MLTIAMRIGDELKIELPGGLTASIVITEPDESGDDGPSFPELDIMLPGNLAVNCFGDHLRPAETLHGDSHILAAKQIVIPLEPTGA